MAGFRNSDRASAMNAIRCFVSYFFSAIRAFDQCHFGIHILWFVFSCSISILGFIRSICRVLSDPNRACREFRYSRGIRSLCRRKGSPVSGNHLGAAKPQGTAAEWSVSVLYEGRIYFFFPFFSPNSWTTFPSGCFFFSSLIRSPKVSSSRASSASSSSSE